jgi:hypothetical protein
MFNIQQDFIDPANDAIHRSNSYYGLVPSIDFGDEPYQFFLHFATAEELEKDIVTKETTVKIAEMLGKDLTKWGWNILDT